MKVLITGFGEFHGISDNPSKTLLQYLLTKADELKQSNDDIELIFQILEVSVEDCEPLLKTFITDEKHDYVIIHMGVNSSAKAIALEQCCYNSKTFRVPDNRNYQPINEKIIDSFDLDQPLTTNFPVQLICAETNQLITTYNNSNANCFSCFTNRYSSSTAMVSTDPGRFLCNYVYFNALFKLQELQKPLNAIFIHVPTFNTIKQEQQQMMVTFIIQQLINFAKMGNANSKNEEN
jgi:pyroglutamyl-peptidase